ncbi:FAD:protein FMN transferase [Halomonas urumqiensis]|uniref:FAD:protein FMN transferase n=1 Tax=Halomonas urumqiensis TaxID=1684789 RepID=A0A2N7UJZ1_9GAMM|nr:FAD:protein FMN transferase [Halomonas urumqiensis]PMR80753.1 FAD:protein FMN transferase [Halomonas urumqiensis]PTB02711.1 FAD:protein FMN transferase [Halomonas urumqiensis]GHE21209.1 thiamin biosynthesis lipoprotein ApbE [Halomonas urumqiensis]
MNLSALRSPTSLRVVVLGLLGLVVAGCSESDRPLDSPVHLNGDIFGSFYQVTIADPLTQGEAQQLEEGFVAELQDVDAAMSIYRDDSELMVFNQSPLEEWQPLSDELIEVLAISRTVHEQSGGAFDPTVGALVNLWSFGAEARPEEVPAEETLQARLAEVGFDHVEIDDENLQARRLRDVLVDLGGVAKGHGTDRVAAYLDGQGIEHYLVNLGGDLVAKGYRDGEGEPWRIGIEAPLEDRQEARHIVPLPEISMATSGDYRNYFEQDGKRFSHTLDPRTGRPITHRLASVTVAHSSNAWADAWATALMVLGEERGMALAREHALNVVMIVRDDDEWISIVSPAFIELFDESLIDDLGLQPPESLSP